MEESAQERDPSFDAKWFVAFFFESVSAEKEMSESFRSFIVRRAVFQRRFLLIGSTGRTQPSVSVEGGARTRSVDRTQFSISVEGGTGASVRTKKNLIQSQSEKSLLSVRRGVQPNVYGTDSGLFRRTFIEAEQQLQKKAAAMKQAARVKKITLANNESDDELISIMKNRAPSKPTRRRKKRGGREVFRKRK